MRTLFVTPDEAPRTAPAKPAQRCSSVALLAGARDAAWLGAAVALGLLRGSQASCALVCVWAHEAQRPVGWASPGVRSSRRLATVLSSRGLNARAAGRLVWVALSADDDVAAAEATRAFAAAANVPVVLAVGGPRGEALDDAVRAQDHVMVFTQPGAPAALAEIAVEGLAVVRSRVSAHVVAGNAATRALALAGVSAGSLASGAAGAAVREVV